MAYYSPWNMNVAKRYESLSGTNVPSAALLDASMRSKMALALQEKGLQDDQDSYNKRIAEERRRFDIESADRRSAIDSQKDSQLTQSLTSLGTTGAMLLGKEGIKDLASYGASGLKSVAPGALEWAGNVTGIKPAAEGIYNAGANITGLYKPISEVGSGATKAMEGVISAAPVETGGITATGIGEANAGELTAMMDSGVGAPVGMSSAELGVVPAEVSPFGGTAGTVGAVAAYIAGAEMARNLWGGKGIPYEEKTKQQKTVDSPGTSGIMPWTRLASEGSVPGRQAKLMSTFERTAMAPIDFIFSGDWSSEGLARADQQARQNLDTIYRSLKNPFTDADDPSGWGTAANVVLNPVGAIVDFIEDACIIVTACTNRNSEEVDITRQYRDRYLDQDQLRGYYWLAEKIVPKLNSEKRIKFCKKHLVDKLVEYGSYKLGITEVKPSIKSTIVSKVFLGTIKSIGYMLPQYIRLNGEVY